MNWLIYIGGGFIFLLFILDKVVGLKIEMKKVNKNWQMLSVFSLIILAIISTILIWVWICWKFIR